MWNFTSFLACSISDLLRLLCKPVPLTAAEEGRTKPQRLCAPTSSVWVVLQEVTEGLQGPTVLSIHPSLCPRQLQMSFQLVLTFISERDYYKLQQRQLNLINVCPDEQGLDHSLPCTNCCDLPTLSNLSARGWLWGRRLCSPNHSLPINWLPVTVSHSFRDSKHPTEEQKELGGIRPL